jgi:hypothetical protein
MACGMVFSLVYLGEVWLAGVLTQEEADVVRRKVAVLIPQTSRKIV